MSSGLVAHVSTAKTWRGGEQQALYLATGMHSRGWPTLVVAQPGSPLAERARSAGLRVEEIEIGSEFGPGGIWEVSRLLKKEKASLVHAHDGHAVTVAAFGARLAGGGVRKVCTRRVDFSLRGRWKYTWGMDRVICISQAIRDICVKAGVKPEFAPVVMSGIDLERIRGAKENREKLAEEFSSGSKHKPLFLLNVASLTDHKGQKYLIEAMNEVVIEFPQAVLIIVGEGELEDELKRQVNLLALDRNVFFAGFRDDVPQMLQACDLFVMSSHLEGLCTSAMDAMAAGKAVVASDAGGLPEVVGEGGGVLVPPRDAKALSLALLDILRDRKKRERCGRAAYERATKLFGVDKMVEGNLAIYREVGVPGA
jgi:glycosyltransferase involved in cell wall biosynthesis